MGRHVTYMEESTGIYRRARITFDAMELTSALYSQRWILHPEGTRQRQIVESYMNSLAESGELLKTSHFNSQLTRKALKTIEEFEEEERKHRESVSMSRRMIWLTLAIVLLAVVQAGIVKLPALVNFADSSISVSNPQAVRNADPTTMGGENERAQPIRPARTHRQQADEANIE